MSVDSNSTNKIMTNMVENHDEHNKHESNGTKSQVQTFRVD